MRWRAGKVTVFVADGASNHPAARLQAIATPLVPNMDKVQIIPPPKDVDPKVLAWKGAAVLGKMDSVADLWLTPADWVCSIPRYNICALIDHATGYARNEGIKRALLLPLSGLPRRCW